MSTITTMRSRPMTEREIVADNLGNGDGELIRTKHRGWPSGRAHWYLWPDGTLVPPVGGWGDNSESEAGR